METIIKNKIQKQCLSCEKFFVQNRLSRFQIYCSSKCYGESKIGIPSVNKGKKLTQEHIDKLVKSHLGIKMPPFSATHRLNMALARKGEKSHLWKGGISKENEKIRRGIEFRLWREAVFARDNWTCQDCKVRGGELHPHHIKEFALYPELRFAIDNGKTLCAECHRKTDSWGKLNKK